MQISPVGISFRPYIYNTNTVSANSLNKISGIEDDALKSSVDYSNDKNENPLKLGETSNFADVLAMQFQLGQNNAARVMKPAEDIEEPAKKDLVTSVIKNTENVENQNEKEMEILEGQMLNNNETSEKTPSNTQMTIENEKLNPDGISKDSSSQGTVDKTNTSWQTTSNLFLMNKAIEAYTSALAV